jgi:hypothetical protein
LKKSKIKKTIKKIEEKKNISNLMDKSEKPVNRVTQKDETGAKFGRNIQNGS